MKEEEKRLKNIYDQGRFDERMEKKCVRCGNEDNFNICTDCLNWCKSSLLRCNDIETCGSEHEIDKIRSKAKEK